jgi:hypothetical protein
METVEVERGLRASGGHFCTASHGPGSARGCPAGRGCALMRRYGLHQHYKYFVYCSWPKPVQLSSAAISQDPRRLLRSFLFLRTSPFIFGYSILCGRTHGIRCCEPSLEVCSFVLSWSLLSHALYFGRTYLHKNRFFVDTGLN